MKGQFSRLSGDNSTASLLPEPVTVIRGDSPVIFSGPHNGLAVTDDPEKPLGMDRKWFEQAHEASDLNMRALFQRMIPRFPAASFIWGNYSRLICDTNRMPGMAIAETSSEHENMVIPGNAPGVLTQQEREARMNGIYWPYHNALAELVRKTHEKHGSVLLIDMHSFAPVWLGRRRKSEIGILTMNEQDPIARISGEFLTERSGLRYINRQPYFLPERVSITAAPMVMKNTGAPYFGFEIRNDLIADEAGQDRLCDMMKNYLQFMEWHPHGDLVLSGNNGIGHTEDRARSQPPIHAETRPEPEDPSPA